MKLTQRGSSGQNRAKCQDVAVAICANGQNLWECQRLEESPRRGVAKRAGCQARGSGQEGEGSKRDVDQASGTVKFEADRKSTRLNSSH